MNNNKVELPSNRLDWNPTPLTEQVVLVTTVDDEGRPHAATKSRVSVISYGPPTIIVFGCQAKYQTAANVELSKQFVINIPGDNLVATAWVIGTDPSIHGPEVFVDNGLTPIDSMAVDAPRIAECRAHVECELIETRRFGDDLAVFGRVVSTSADKSLLGGDEAARYHKLAPFFFLDFQRTATLDAVRRVEEPIKGPRHDITVLATDDLPRAVNFYSKAFDWSLRVNTNKYAEFAGPSARAIALIRTDAMANIAGTTLAKKANDQLSRTEIYFRCDDLPRTIARLVSAGARELSDLAERDWGEQVAYFADPDGNIIAVSGRLSD